MKTVDPYTKLMLTMQVALASYDAENAVAKDRHPSDCPCGYCEFVRCTRDIVKDYDFPSSGTVSK